MSVPGRCFHLLALRCKWPLEDDSGNSARMKSSQQSLSSDEGGEAGSPQIAPPRPFCPIQRTLEEHVEHYRQTHGGQYPDAKTLISISHVSRRTVYRWLARQEFRLRILTRPNSAPRRRFVPNGI